MSCILNRTALSLSISSLLLLESCNTTHILMYIVYFYFLTRIPQSFIPVFIGVANYFYEGFSGGFVSGIFLAIWNYQWICKHLSTLCLLSGMILILALLILALNSTALDFHPFGLTWWLDAVLAILVSVTCSSLLEKLC